MKGTILEKIIEAKRRRIDAAGRGSPVVEPQHERTRGRFREALTTGKGPKIIAEFKRASPSRGVINNGLEPAEAAMKYQRGGAAAISVLTEEDFFNGSLDDLRAVRAAVDLPVLRKDFIIDETQIRESARAGADAILLIVAALAENDLRRFHAVAGELGLDVLVEVHNSDEMDVASRLGAGLIGVNNRNLSTFQVSLDVSRRLIGHAPEGATLIAESGIRSRAEIEELFAIGYSGFLIGESLMISSDPSADLAKLAADTTL